MDEKATIGLLARGLTFLKCPRQSPWGRSVSVNHARIDESEKESLLVIEMQSGDVIEASIQDMTLGYL
jgi:hypothetical protein